jgi:hypothetical protein
VHPPGCGTFSSCPSRTVIHIRRNIRHRRRSLPETGVSSSDAKQLLEAADLHYDSAWQQFCKTFEALRTIARRHTRGNFMMAVLNFLLLLIAS